MFFKKIDTRIKYVILIALLLFFIIFLKIFYIQVFEYKKLSTLEDELISRELPIVAERGRILDRNGIVLADNLTTTSLIVIPNQVEDKEYTAKVISKILDVSFEDIFAHVTKKVSIERIHPEGRNLSFDVADKISSYNLPGVYLVKK